MQACQLSLGYHIVCGIATRIHVSSSAQCPTGCGDSSVSHLPHYVSVKLLRILTVSTCAKLYFTIFLYHNLYLNELVKADIYYPMFSIVRLCCLTVAKNFISPEALIYVIAVLQFMSSAYKYFHIEYYNPEIEWCSTITEIWGWVSVIQWAFLIYGMRFTVLNLAIFAIGLMVYFPSAPMLIILERKVKNVLARAERQRSK